MNIKKEIKSMKTQRGTALFVALMLLLILTLGALAAMSSSILQERMVAASFQSLRAAQNAQRILADGERRAFEFMTRMDPTVFFSECEKLSGGQSCASVGGIRAVTNLANLLQTPLPAALVTPLCGPGQLMAMSILPPPRALGQAVEERLFQLTASAAVCTGSPPTANGALPVVVQSYYSP